MPSDTPGRATRRSVTIGQRHDLGVRRMLRTWLAPLVCLLLGVFDVAVTHHIGAAEVFLFLLVLGAPLASLRLSRRPESWVELTPNALVDAVSPAQRCEVPWTMVHDVVPAPDAREVQLIVHDPAGSLERLPQVERLDGSPNRLGAVLDPWARVHIPTNLLGTDPTILAARITEYWRSAR